MKKCRCDYCVNKYRADICQYCDGEAVYLPDKEAISELTNENYFELEFLYERMA